MAGLGSSLRLTSPSAGPSAARIDHLNRQVADLVAQNKDAQLRIVTLERNVQDERARGEQAMTDVVAKWHSEREEWQDMIDFIQGAHQIAYLRTRDELHATRIAVINEQDRVARERQRRLRKEFNLMLSQEKEQDLQREVTRLTDELEIAKEDLQFEAAQASATEAQKLHAMKQKCSKIEEQKKQKSNELAVAINERDKLERELDKLRTAQATLSASLESNKTKLERVTLKLDGAQNTQTELERKNNELKLSNKDLKQQLDKWQSLETKGGAEVEMLRKSNLDLEARLKDSHSLLRDAEKKESQSTKALQKEQKKVASLIVEREQLQDQLTTLEEELGQAKRDVAKAAKRQLHSSTETDGKAKARGKAAVPPKHRSPSPPATEVVSETEQEVEEPPPKSKKRPRPERDEDEGDGRARSAKNNRPRQNVDESDEDGQAARKRAKPRAQSRQPAADDDDDPQPSRSKGKGKARSPVEPEATNPPRRDKPSSSSVREKPASTSSRQKPPSSNTGGSKKPSGSSRPPPEPIAEEDEETIEPEPKKKRKIFLPPSQPTSFPTTFEWNVPQDSALNIPTALSPIKEPATASKSFLHKVGIGGLFGIG